MIVSALFVGYLAVFLAVQAGYSLGWRFQHDFPLLHYAAWLMVEHGKVPYRDFFETSMPGTFGYQALIVRLVGFGEVPLRLLDLGLLAVASGLLMFILRAFPWVVRIGAAALFGLCYLELGPEMSLQRDFIGLLPVAVAVALALPSDRPAGPGRWFAIGLSFGLAATVKPHLALGAIVVLPCLWWEFRGHEEFRGHMTKFPESGHVSPKFPRFLAAAAVVGLLLPWALALVWLSREDALAPFWEMTRQYLPLHIDLSGDYRMLAGGERPGYLFWSYLDLGTRAVWLIPILSGLWLGLTAPEAPPERRRTAAMLGLLALVYSFYPVLGGKFWSYHWLPFQFFAVALACTNLAPGRMTAGRAALLGLFILVMLWDVGPSPAFREQLAGHPPPPPKQGRVDAMAGFLRERLRPGDLVQPLDWTGGALHAMLLARAPIATPFLYDYHFYHHLGNPFVEELRARFLARLREARPAYILEVYLDKPWITGPGSTLEFPALRAWLREQYGIAQRGDGYVIYQRRTP
ncbi:MAG: hypothetical protein GX442_14975 [Candidatus Riflebacteria bacterium]|nr:hypothetical protein [Candidatus Riflebacteria bacterium]